MQCTIHLCVYWVRRQRAFIRARMLRLEGVAIPNTTAEVIWVLTAGIFGCVIEPTSDLARIVPRLTLTARLIARLVYEQITYSFS